MIPPGPRETPRPGRADRDRHARERHARASRPGWLCGVEADTEGGGGVAEGGAGIRRDDALGRNTAPEGFLRAVRL